MQLLENKLNDERGENEDRVKKKIYNRFSLFIPELNDSDSEEEECDESDDDDIDDNVSGGVVSIGDVEEDQTPSDALSKSSTLTAPRSFHCSSSEKDFPSNESLASNPHPSSSSSQNSDNGGK